MRRLAGIGAPASFIGAWLVAGARTPGYSTVHDHVSDLAAIGAPTRPLMTTGLLAFGGLAPVWATTLQDRRVQVAMATAGLGTLGVAAAPLGSSFGDGPHVVAAAVSYVAMALTPALGARTFGAPRTSYALTVLASALLIGSTLGEYDGALQRAGLGVTDSWMIVQALRQRTSGVTGSGRPRK
jgi:hypothetical membrane protein